MTTAVHPSEAVAIAPPAEGIHAAGALPSGRRHDANIAGAQRIAAGEAGAVEAAIFGPPLEAAAAQGIGGLGRDHAANRLAPPQGRLRAARSSSRERLSEVSNSKRASLPAAGSLKRIPSRKTRL